MKKKLKFTELNVQSFITTLNKNKNSEIIGGGNTGNPCVPVSQNLTCFECTVIMCTTTCYTQRPQLCLNTEDINACNTTLYSDLGTCPPSGSSNQTGPEGCC